jgi:hypothetical protein
MSAPPTGTEPAGGDQAAATAAAAELAAAAMPEASVAVTGSCLPASPSVLSPADGQPASQLDWQLNNHNTTGAAGDGSSGSAPASAHATSTGSESAGGGQTAGPVMSSAEGQAHVETQERTVAANASQGPQAQPASPPVSSSAENVLAEIESLTIEEQPSFSAPKLPTAQRISEEQQQQLLDHRRQHSEAGAGNITAPFMKPAIPSEDLVVGVILVDEPPNRIADASQAPPRMFVALPPDRTAFQGAAAAAPTLAQRNMGMSVAPETDMRRAYPPISVQQHIGGSVVTPSVRRRIVQHFATASPKQPSPSYRLSPITHPASAPSHTRSQSVPTTNSKTAEDQLKRARKKSQQFSQVHPPPVAPLLLRQPETEVIKLLLQIYDLMLHPDFDLQSTRAHVSRRQRQENFPMRSVFASHVNTLLSGFALDFNLMSNDIDEYSAAIHGFVNGHADKKLDYTTEFIKACSALHEAQFGAHPSLITGPDAINNLLNKTTPSRFLQAFQCHIDMVHWQTADGSASVDTSKWLQEAPSAKTRKAWTRAQLSRQLQETPLDNITVDLLNVEFPIWTRVADNKFQEWKRGVASGAAFSSLALPNWLQTHTIFQWMMCNCVDVRMEPNTPRAIYFCFVVDPLLPEDMRHQVYIGEALNGTRTRWFASKGGSSHLAGCRRALTGADAQLVEFVLAAAILHESHRRPSNQMTTDPTTGTLFLFAAERVPDDQDLHTRQCNIITSTKSQSMALGMNDIC